MDSNTKHVMVATARPLPLWTVDALRRLAARALEALRRGAYGRFGRRVPCSRQMLQGFMMVESLRERTALDLFGYLFL